MYVPNATTTSPSAFLGNRRSRGAQEGAREARKPREEPRAWEARRQKAQAGTREDKGGAREAREGTGRPGSPEPRTV